MAIIRYLWPPFGKGFETGMQFKEVCQIITS